MKKTEMFVSAYVAPECCLWESAESQTLCASANIEDVTEEDFDWS